MIIGSWCGGELRTTDTFWYSERNLIPAAFFIRSCKKWSNVAFSTCTLAEVESRTAGWPVIRELGEKEGALSNPRGCGPPSVAPSIPFQDPAKIPADSIPHYLPISGSAPPPDITEMEGFTVGEVEKKNRSFLVFPRRLLTRLENQRMWLETNKSILMMTTRGWIWHLRQNSHHRREQWEAPWPWLSTRQPSDAERPLCTIMSDQSKQFASY